jgi:hypothetical protein
MPSCAGQQGGFGFDLIEDASADELAERDCGTEEGVIPLALDSSSDALELTVDGTGGVPSSPIGEPGRWRLPCLAPACRRCWYDRSDESGEPARKDDRGVVVNDPVVAAGRRCGRCGHVPAPSPGVDAGPGPPSGIAEPDIRRLAVVQMAPA